MMSYTPPRPPPINYTPEHGTRWQREKAAAGPGAKLDNLNDPKSVGPWIIGECVGRGASGRVRIAKHSRTGQLAAVKILPIQPILNSRASLATKLAKSDRKRLEIDREIIMLKLMNHPNIIRIYDVYENQRELFLILEYVEGGELFDFLVHRQKLPHLEALAFFKQIIYALNYAHSFSIIHRDLKPENILIHSLNPPLIKIADWGMAAFAPPSRQLETCCGSPHYASPEIVAGMKYKGSATDIWSCGVILHALLTGRLPFDGENVKELLAKVSAGKFEMPADIDPQAQDLLSRMLVVDASKRLTIPEILSHPWFQTPTPGVVYVPAPSVSELARPLRSPAHIDKDLFDSLRVIWGQHADPNAIKWDLLSPEGNGTLSKAFYFLLQKYREKTLEQHGLTTDRNKPSLTARGKSYYAPSLHNRLEVDTRGRGHVRSSRAPPSRSPTPVAVLRTPNLAPPSMIESNLRPRPPSPLGPRPPKPRPLSTPVPVPNPAHTPTNNTPRSPKVVMPSSPPPSPSPYSSPRADGHPNRQGPTYLQHGPLTESPQKISYVRFPTTTSPRQQHHQSLSPAMDRRRVPRPSSTLPPDVHLHAPVPLVPRSNAPGTLPMLISPRTENLEVQRAIDNITERMNVLTARGNAEQSVGYFPASENRQTPPNRTPVLGRHHYTTDDHGGYNAADKENWVDEGMGYDIVDAVQKPEPLGFLKPRAGTGKLAPSVVIEKDTRGDLLLKEKKERKSRPPTLNFHQPSPNTKRSTVSALPLTTLTSPPPTPFSPVIGEFKGWFSNLFSWRAHTYVLYSPDDMPATQDESIRLLQHFGVNIWMEESDGGRVVLRCRVNDSYDPTSGAIIQKRTCFRVEFASAPGAGPGAGPPPSSPRPRHHHGEPTSPHPFQGGFSPNLGSARSGVLNNNGRNNGNSNNGVLATKMPGYVCAIVLVQEKGSTTTFRAVYKKFKEEWRLDSGLRSPGVGVVGGGGHGGSTPVMELTSRFST